MSPLSPFSLVWVVTGYTVTVSTVSRPHASELRIEPPQIEQDLDQISDFSSWTVSLPWLRYSLCLRFEVYVLLFESFRLRVCDVYVFRIFVRCMRFSSHVTVFERVCSFVCVYWWEKMRCDLLRSVRVEFASSKALGFQCTFIIIHYAYSYRYTIHYHMFIFHCIAWTVHVC